MKDFTSLKAIQPFDRSRSTRHLWRYKDHHLSQEKQRLPQKTVTNSPEESHLKVNKIFHVFYCPVDNDLLSIISSASIQQTKEERRYFNHFTGFNSYSDFKNSLLFLLPGLDRRQITYWGTKPAQESYINTEKLFGSDKEETDDSDIENPSESDIPSNRMTWPDAHDL